MSALRPGVLLVALAGCVPAVEDVVIRCESGPETCPTGWHCTADAFCRPGDAPPDVRWLDPSPDAAVVGRTTVHFEGSSPRGVASATLRIVAPQGLVATLVADPLVTHDDGRRMTFAASWTTWGVDDGSYELEAVVVPASGPPGPGRASLRVRVANGAPRLTIASPADGAIVDGAVPVVATFSGSVPVASMAAELQQPPGVSTPVPVDLAFDDAEQLGGSVSVTLDASALADGPATAALHVTDLRGRVTTTGIPLLVEHVR